jgi:hypothetical protein
MMDGGFAYSQNIKDQEKYIYLECYSRKIHQYLLMDWDGESEAM